MTEKNPNSSKSPNENSENGPATITTLPTAHESKGKEGQEERGVGRPPEISDADVYEACNQLFQKGIEPKKINGYKIRQHFGKGTPGRFDKIADKWRQENRYEQTTANRQSSSAQESQHPLTDAFKALDSVKTAIETGAKTIAERHEEKLKVTKQQAEDEIKEVAGEAKERDQDAQEIIAELEKKQVELESVIKGLESKLQKSEQERANFKELAAQAKTTLDQLLPKYKILQEKEQSISAIERERDNAQKAQERAESQYDQLKIDADKREASLNKLLTDANRTRDELLESTKTKDHTIKEKDQALDGLRSQIKQLEGAIHETKQDKKSKDK